MQIKALSVGFMGANCYIVSAGSDAAVIDPGSEPERIFAELEKLGLAPSAILLTHGHFDHIMAAEEIRAKYNAPVYVHKGDEKMLSDENENLLVNFPFTGNFYPVKEFITVSDGEEISAGALKFLTLHTPGHSKGSCSFICEDVIFTGDTLFRSSIGRTDFPGGSFSKMENSLKELKELPGNYKVFPGHGQETDLDYERRGNIYLAGLEEY